MNIRITARHFDLTPELKNYARSNLDHLSRFVDNIIDAHLIMDVEKHRNSAELTMSVNGHNLVVHTTTDDMYASIDDIRDKMERRLKKYHAKVNEHRGMTEEEKARIAAEINEHVREEGGISEKQV